MRFGLKKSLEQFAELKIVGEAANGVEAVNKARALKPSVVIMDIGLPELNGIDATRMIKNELESTRVIMLTSFDDAERTCASLAAGADGYCVKSIPAGRLVNAIATIHAGNVWLDPTIAGHVLKVHNVPDKNKSANTTESVVPEDEDKNLSDLTGRELEVLRFLMEGMIELDIASRFGVNVPTVRGYVRNILKKLSTNEKTQNYLNHLQPGLA